MLNSLVPVSEYEDIIIIIDISLLSYDNYLLQTHNLYATNVMVYHIYRERHIGKGNT